MDIEKHSEKQLKTQKFTLPNGETIELFYIGTLAHALGRTSACIRKWEIGGILPDPMFRDTKGRRLYSEEQIDAIVSCAERANVRQGHGISNSSFPKWVRIEWEKIKEKYKGE